MKRTLLISLFACLYFLSFSQYWGFTDAQRNENDARRIAAKVKMKISVIQGISMYDDQVHSEKINYEKYNRLGSLTENGTIENGKEIKRIKRYYDEDNQLIRQDHFRDTNRLSSIRY